MAGPDPALSRLLAKLGPLLGDRLRTDADALSAAAGDESGLAPVEPGAVAWPITTEETSEICRAAAQYGVGLVPRGGGTGKAGGCIPHRGALVVDMSRMTSILELKPEDTYAIVEPGVITADLDAAVAERGYMYPPDPGSRESCTLGGNIATNAGGPRALKYGVTHNYVWGLDIVLSGGRTIRTGRLSIKGVAGLDLTSLLVGSEGTLGFITRAVLHIIPSPADVQTAWLFFSDPMSASSAATAIFAAGIRPRVMELVDKVALDLVRPVSPFAIPQAGAGLLVETDGPVDAAFDELRRLCDLASDHGLSSSAVASSEKDRLAMRRARQLVSSAMKEAYPLKISDDVAVPRSRMVDLLEIARLAGAEAGVTISTYGHLGDGNLHVNILCRDAAEQTACRELQRRIVTAAVSMGGTISGEHGIGLAKRDQLSLEQSESLIDLQRQLKALFDPQGIMNPGKVFGEP